MIISEFHWFYLFIPVYHWRVRGEVYLFNETGGGFMFTRINSSGIQGIGAYPVSVEADVANGLPGFPYPVSYPQRSGKHRSGSGPR